MGDTCLEVGRNVNRAWPKLTTSMVEAYQEHSRNIPRTQSKHVTSTVETYHEHNRNPIQHGQNIRTVTTFENCQIMPRIRLKHTTSIVKTYHDHDRNIPRADQTYHEHGQNKKARAGSKYSRQHSEHQNCDNIPLKLSKHTTSTIETYHERIKHITSTVKTKKLERGRNILEHIQNIRTVTTYL